MHTRSPIYPKPNLLNAGDSPTGTDTNYQAGQSPSRIHQCSRSQQGTHPQHHARRAYHLLCTFAFLASGASATAVTRPAAKQRNNADTAAERKQARHPPAAPRAPCSAPAARRRRRSSPVDKAMRLQQLLKSVACEHTLRGRAWRWMRHRIGCTTALRHKSTPATLMPTANLLQTTAEHCNAALANSPTTKHPPADTWPCSPPAAPAPGWHAPPHPAAAA